ncbi:MAG: hypothetical protein Q8K62_12305 [Thiobacillus sp.]|nr:hypothetical protein [Thiobacillus sp.]
MNIDKEADPNGWENEAYFCETCGKPFRRPLFDVSKQFERTIFCGNNSPAEVEVIGSEGIAQYCSRACRDPASTSLLQRENVRATYPDIGPIEFCSRCTAPVDMTKFHLAYVESVLDGEWESMSTNVLEVVVLAILCNGCFEPPPRLIADVDFPVDEQMTTAVARTSSK